MQCVIRATVKHIQLMREIMLEAKPQHDWLKSTVFDGNIKPVPITYYN